MQAHELIILGLPASDGRTRRLYKKIGLCTCMHGQAWRDLDVVSCIVSFKSEYWKRKKA